MNSRLLEVLWQKYDPDDQGFMLRKDAHAFLKELASSLNVPYTYDRGEWLLGLCGCPEGMDLRKHRFKTIVAAARNDFDCM